MKVVILILFFGKWPDWLQYFLKSCRNNKDFSWLLISDAGKPGNCPQNVQYLNFSLEDFNNLASSRLKMKIRVNNPYKLCDLRPAYGLIFNDYIADADFWGYSDLDLVYGNLSHFLSREVLEENDIISCRENYFAGHFALYRNKSTFNKLFELSPGHRKIFEDPHKHYAFDERSNYWGRKLPEKSEKTFRQTIHSRLEFLIHKFKYKCRIGLPESPPDMSSIISHFAADQGIRIYRKDMVRSDNWFKKNKLKNWEIAWMDGELQNVTEKAELMHFHFINSKNNPIFDISPIKDNSNFSITSSGINPC